MSLRMRYQTIEFGDIDIHLRTLRDEQQYPEQQLDAQALGVSTALWSVFGVIWPSSIVLANYMLTFDMNNKRILEVGCGIGLASHLLNYLHADITATDIHPSAEEFLLANTALNDGELIPFERMDWKNTSEQLGKFDVIIGSDLLYEEDHVKSLPDFIDTHTTEACEVIIVDPCRGLQNKFTKKMIGLGFDVHEDESQSLDESKPAFEGKIIRFSRKLN